MKKNIICEKVLMLFIVPGGNFFLGQDSNIKQLTAVEFPIKKTPIQSPFNSQPSWRQCIKNNMLVYFFCTLFLHPFYAADKQEERNEEVNKLLLG